MALLAASLLQEHIAPIAGAHGGRISIRKVTDGVVTVDLAGACHGCPAAVFTLKQRFEAVLQRSAPGARVVEA
nr:NifU family protein [Kocuria sp. JC486]